ncbi:MAG: helix-turn-helix domain-containing protein [Flavobacteriaceae bacterium]|nr:helix-turn-helix domain-containing protein [Flavobacteriaceae bacterium]
MQYKAQPNSRMLCTKAAAHYLGLAASTLNKMRLKGNGPEFIKLGPRRVVYDLRDLDRWLASRRRKSTSQYLGCDLEQPKSEGTR